MKSLWSILFIIRISIAILGLNRNATGLSSGVNCTFEDNTCLWQTESHHGLSWEPHKGRMGSWMTGPTIDVTLGTANGHYMSVSTTGIERHNIQTVSMTSPLIEEQFYQNGACFQFWYYMYGSFVGTLDILLNSEKSGKSEYIRKIWTRSGNQGPEWRYAQFDLPPTHVNISMTFKVTTTEKSALHAAIDDIIITSEACQPTVTCDFENGLCGYKNLKNNELKWILRQPGTDKIAMKFQSDHTLGLTSGHFIYVNGKGSPGDGGQVVLKSPVLPPNKGSCLHFWYNIIAETSEVLLQVSLDQIKSLEVKQSSTSSVIKLNIHGYRGQGWQLASVNISSSVSFYFVILIEAPPEINFILGIDDIDIVAGLCSADDFCDFEHNACSWQNAKTEDDFNWIRANGGELYTVSMARTDHTLQSTQGKYLLLHNNLQDESVRKARLISKTLHRSTWYCLRFWYLMETSYNSTLSVRILGTVSNPIVSLKFENNTHSYLWRSLVHTIIPQPLPFRLALEGSVRKSGNSYIAIDDVSLQEGSCSSTPKSVGRYVYQCKRNKMALTYSQLCDFNNDCSEGEEEKECGYNCDFEEDSCRWVDSSTEGPFWVMTDGKSYSSHVLGIARGLRRDHTKSSSDGHFMVVSVSSHKMTTISESLLRSPVIQRSSSSCKLMFYYSVTRPEVWSLHVNKEIRGQVVPHFRLDNTTSRYWRRIFVNLGYIKGPFQITIVARRTTQTVATIALDDIKFRDCNFPQPTSSCDYWNRFKCRNGACINSNSVCNFADDCDDNTDEEESRCAKYSRCDFEQGLCSWTQDAISDSLDWSLVTGELTLQPRFDHTTGYPLGSFLKIKGNYRLHRNHARLLSPVFQKTRNCRLNFYVTVNGTDLDQLKLYIQNDLGKNIKNKLTVSAVGGNYWKLKSLSISSKDPFQIVIEGILGNGVDRFIALDDISLSPECVISTQLLKNKVLPTIALPVGSPCNQSTQWECRAKSQCIFLHQRCDFENQCTDRSDELDCGECDFEMSTCGWTDISKGKYAWSRIKDVMSPSGMETTHTHNKTYSSLRINHAMVLSDTGSKYIRVSLLKSPVYGATRPTCHIVFYFTKEIWGYLGLYLYPKEAKDFETLDSGTMLWHYKKGARWRRVAVNVGSYAADFVLLFRYDHVKGPSDAVITIDDISFSESCSKGAPKCDFQCQFTNRCVSASEICDMNFDCRHGEDETTCDEYQQFDFENGIGSLTHASSDFYWKRTSWKIEMSSVVPGRDHTLGTNDGYYLVVPVSSTTSRAIEKAKVMSPIFYPNSHQTCVLRYFYHSRYHLGGSIRIYRQIYENGELYKIWEMDTVGKNIWIRASLVLNVTHAFRVVIEGLRRPGYQGGLAIDDVSFTPECINTNLATLDHKPSILDSGPCVEDKEFTCDSDCMPMNKLCDFTIQCNDGMDEAYCPSQCDFENGFCSWLPNGKENLIWEIGKSRLYDIKDHTATTSDGHFLVARSGFKRRIATLTSPLFAKAGPKCSISFWYKMKLNSISCKAELRISLRTKGYDEVLCIKKIVSESFDNKEWTKVSVSLPPCATQFQISVLVVFDNPSLNCSLLLDDVSFDNCEDKPDINVNLTCEDPFHFRCDDGRCILRDNLCDLRADCCDRSDEDGSVCNGFSKFTYETGLQSWTNGAGTSSRWMIQNGLKNEIFNEEFPLYDHTESSPIGKYLSVSESKSNSKTDTGILVKEMPAPSPGCTITFWYQMTGTDSKLCKLMVRIREILGGHLTLLRNITDVNMAGMWIKDSINADLTKPYELFFEGIQPAGSSSHVSLDDIVFSPECNLQFPETPDFTRPTVSTRENTIQRLSCEETEFQCNADALCIDGGLKCNFRADCTDESDEATCGTLHECEFDEDNYCFWSNSGQEKFVWMITSSLSEAPFTGPSADDNGRKNHYIFFNYTGKRLRKLEIPSLTSPLLISPSAKCVFQFYYITKSFHNSTLSLNISSAGSTKSTSLWQTSQETNVWRQIRVGIGRQNSPFTLSFYLSSSTFVFKILIALDKIKYEHCGIPIPQGHCSDKFFRCDDGECIDPYAVCDFQADCFDHSDEKESLCADIYHFGFEDSKSMKLFRQSKFGHLQWRIWNNSIKLDEGARGADHTMNSARGQYLYTTGLTNEKYAEEAWLFSPEFKATNITLGCKVTFYALIPSPKQSLRFGYSLNDEDKPSITLDVLESTGKSGSFWQKVSARVSRTQPFRLVLIGRPGVQDAVIGLDDIIFGPGCSPTNCEFVKGGCQKDPYVEENKSSQKGLILHVVVGVLGALGLIVIVTGSLVYLHTLKIIGKPSKWKRKENDAIQHSDYQNIDDNESVEGEMFERSSISI